MAPKGLNEEVSVQKNQRKSKGNFNEVSCPDINLWAARVSVVLSGLGVVFFLYEKFRDREEEQIEGHFFPIVSIIEWIIPFVGFADAVYNLSQTGGG